MTSAVADTARHGFRLTYFTDHEKDAAARGRFAIQHGQPFANPLIVIFEARKRDDV
jgi:hypothetical protein